MDTFDLRDIAQSNLHLYRQVASAGGPDDVALLAKCNEVACAIMGRDIRSTGKSLITHHVGTASVVLLATSDVRLAAAGMLHASFTHGIFEDGRKGATPAHVAWMRAVISEDIVDVVQRFGGYRTFRKDLMEGRMTPESAGVGLDILVLRLANQVDDALYSAAEIGGKAAYKDADIMGLVAETADAMDLPVIARAARAVQADNEACGNPGGLGPVKVVPFIARPKSWWKRGR